MVLDEPAQLAHADKLLFMPDLFAYFLTGVQRAEYQRSRPRRSCWIR